MSQIRVKKFNNADDFLYTGNIFPQKHAVTQRAALTTNHAARELLNFSTVLFQRCCTTPRGKPAAATGEIGPQSTLARPLL